MLKKVSKIEVRFEDKEELKEAQKRVAAFAASSNATGDATTLLQHFDWN